MLSQYAIFCLKYHFTTFLSDMHHSSAHSLQEDNFDLVTSIKSASFYRRGKYLDYVSDYMPPTPYEFKKMHESNR